VPAHPNENCCGTPWPLTPTAAARRSAAPRKTSPRSAWLTSPGLRSRSSPTSPTLSTGRCHRPKEKKRGTHPSLCHGTKKPRLFAGLESLDAYLASAEPLASPVEKLFQGAIADALAHPGQLAMLGRLAGAPSRTRITRGPKSSRDALDPSTQRLCENLTDLVISRPRFSPRLCRTT
jgi:hypothetical protein